MKRIVYWLTRFCFGSLALLPAAWSRWAARSLASIVYTFDRRHRRIGMINLAIAFPGKSQTARRIILHRSFRQLGDLALEISGLPRLTRAGLKQRVQYEAGRGLENYLRAKQEGKGVLFVTAHIGAWELLPVAHVLLSGCPLAFVVRPLENPYLERWVDSIRCGHGNRTLAKSQGVRPVLRRLQSGGDVGFLIDQNVQPRDGIYVPLFGHSASTSSTVAALSLRTGAPIVSGFLYPGARSGHYTIRFYPPFHARRQKGVEDPVREATARLNRQLEQVVREFPHCWLWGHRRFNSQPDGRNLYPDV